MGAAREVSPTAVLSVVVCVALGVSAFASPSAEPRINPGIQVAQARSPEPSRVVRRIVLRGAGFDFDKAVIRPDARVIFDAAAEVLRKNGDVQVEVAGHTCSIGSEAYNEDLSRRRAQAVVNYLISRGIAADRLEPVGYGERAPVADNVTREGRVQNRRVELNILE